MNSNKILNVFDFGNCDDLDSILSQNDKYLFFTYELFPSTSEEERFSVVSSRDETIVSDFKARAAVNDFSSDLFLFAIDSKMSVDAFNALENHSEFVIKLHMYVHCYMEQDFVEMNSLADCLAGIIRQQEAKDLMHLHDSGLSSQKLNPLETSELAF